MASADQIKALLRSHMEGDDTRFYSIAMQLAAHEAKLGHGKFAEELRAMIDSSKQRRTAASLTSKTVHIGQPRGDLVNLLTVTHPHLRFGDMILSESIAGKLNRIVLEQRHYARIKEHGLSPRRKLMLVGPPGTGKTMTASVLASELNLPLFSVRLDSLITKYMGETAAKLRQVFDAISEVKGVYFFDEFDAIGSQRNSNNDVGEIRRVLNSFLQMIEQDQSNSLIIAATNHPEILDYALFRRFDDIIEYGLPNAEEIIHLLKSKLNNFKISRVRWTHLSSLAEELSYAEISRAAEEAIKDALIHDRKLISESDISKMLKERSIIKKT